MSSNLRFLSDTNHHHLTSSSTAVELYNGSFCICKMQIIAGLAEYIHQKSLCKLPHTAHFGPIEHAQWSASLAESMRHWQSHLTSCWLPARSEIKYFHHTALLDISWVCNAQKIENIHTFIGTPFPMIVFGEKCFLGQCVSRDKRQNHFTAQLHAWGLECTCHVRYLFCAVVGSKGTI